MQHGVVIAVAVIARISRPTPFTCVRGTQAVVAIPFLLDNFSALWNGHPFKRLAQPQRMSPLTDSAFWKAVRGAVNKD